MNWDFLQRRRRLLLAAAIAACVLGLLRPTCARAGYPLTAEASVMLGFGVTYRSADATSGSVHRGVDLRTDAGARVRAPLVGQVTFVGRVPAVGGGMATAVTISTTEGAVTLLPLSAVCVSKGDKVVEGDDVGAVAAEGDGSSAGPHLHVGLKRAGLYVDPMSVLAWAAPPGSQPAEGVQPVGAQADARSGAHGHAPARATRGGASATAGARARGPASASGSTLRAPVAGVEIAPGVSVPGVTAEESGAGHVRVESAASAGIRAPEAHATRERPGLSAVAGLIAGARAFAVWLLRISAIAALGVLVGLGLLWPLWRRDVRQGVGENRVSAGSDDVAAVVGR